MTDQEKREQLIKSYEGQIRSKKKVNQKTNETKELS